MKFILPLLTTTLTTMFVSSQALSAISTYCDGVDENGQSIKINAYPAYEDTQDMIVSIFTAQGLQYNYAGTISMTPRPDVYFQIYGRGIQLNVMQMVPGEPKRQADMMTADSPHTYILSCKVSN
jgi:hypothetical protein